MNRIKCIAWDFDGVLNRNVSQGRFHWMDALWDQFGVSGEEFQKVIFGDGFWPIMRGEEDILDRMEAWKSKVGFDGDVAEVLAFWFRTDEMVCANMLGLVERAKQAGLRQVIATNNEDRRSSYIEDEMGFSGRVEKLFSSARMKVAKPDAGYFRHIEQDLGLKPYEILLVDDFRENTDGALACGWHVHHFPEDGHEDLARLLDPIL